MGQELKDVAQQLKDSDKKVQLIYAFNGTGKTRLSNEFCSLINNPSKESDDQADSLRKVLYYNAHTEDLFFWDNDIEFGVRPKLMTQPNSFTDWILNNQGLDKQIIDNFQMLTGSKITPVFSENNTNVSFAVENTDYLATEDGDLITTEGDEPLIVRLEDLQVKISKGEESNFIWSVFYTLLEQVVSTLNIAELEDRDTNQFNDLQYVFIDDPVSSLDENHLIELAVNLSILIKSAPKELKFIITTHNPLFYNVIFSEFKRTKDKKTYVLQKSEDGSFDMPIQGTEFDENFSYHLYIKKLIEDAITEGRVEKYHFALLRNLYEKTASFLGYSKWSDLLPENQELYAARIMNFYSHKKISNEEVREPTNPEKQSVKLLLDNLVNNYGFWKPKE